MSLRNKLIVNGEFLTLDNDQLDNIKLCQVKNINKN